MSAVCARSGADTCDGGWLAYPPYALRTARLARIPQGRRADAIRQRNVQPAAMAE